MGAVEQAIDAAANFVGPFVDADAKNGTQRSGEKNYDTVALVRQAIEHLQAINTADLAADPDAPYDVSLAGVVYGLLDLTISLGILPYLSSGVAFSQRPRSVLVATFTVSSRQHEGLLSETLSSLLSILRQREGTGLQPLIAQRSLPDIISALAELAFAPQRTQQSHSIFEPAYNDLLACSPISRLLPLLTTFLQQPLPAWLKPRMAAELAAVPTRPHGVRHVIEFLSISYLSKNTQIPRDASGPQSRVPIPLEAVTQASKLLVSPPRETNQDEWIRQLAPQLWSLLDGDEGRELSRAAGQIIAGGILCKKATGAPGTVGWKLFAQPILEIISPEGTATAVSRNSTQDRVVVPDQDLLLGLQRLSVITTSYSHAGLISRLVGPVLLPLWALLNYARSKRSLDKVWGDLPRRIISRYITVACDPKQMDRVATNLFWDGNSDWTFGPGTKGGIEIRMRQDVGAGGAGEIDAILSHIGDLTGRVDLLVTLLADAGVSDDIAGLIFLQVTKRWLCPNQNSKATVLLETEHDPLSAFTDAKLSEALASKFKDSFARSPQQIIELVSQILQNYTSDHRVKFEQRSKSHKPSRANLGSIVTAKSGPGDKASKGDTADEDLVSFAISILNTLVAAPDFERICLNDALLLQVTGHLQYLVHHSHEGLVSPVIVNSASSLLQLLTSTAPSSDPSRANVDALAEHRIVLKEALQELTSPEAPNRTWGLSTLLKVIQNTYSFPVIDVPLTTYLVLSASLADAESYVHTAAMPVLVALALRTPHPVINILVEALLDVDERSFKLSKGRMTEEKEQALQEALDYRLRVGEVLNSVILDNDFWQSSSDREIKHTSLQRIASACLSIASRRGQRQKTQSLRQAISLQIVQQQEEEEAAWGGPVPNVFEADEKTWAADRSDYEALSKIVKGWEGKGMEEDVRIRASAMSILGTIFEKRMQFVGQATIDAGLQIVLLILTMETAEAFFLLRRAAVLVVMGLLRALDEQLGAGRHSDVGLGVRQQDEVERVLRWTKDGDGDELVRDHAESVMEGLETLQMKKLYRMRDEGVRLGPDLGLEGGLRGLTVRPEVGGRQERQGRARMVVEEME
ncbi:uncharacterized protein EKO05_0001351 [Ascochyta rabiei]|uniref:Uncharacterized protein n=1 Tax=Didymella rabiei TaxID=5454 RepID=A0A163LGZ2_DIDRA|nr:uncharacterized protein EKO05_0001351 [Ascochyta rabiei]KZM27795.1 hypothetical protein ST47_g1064 [Ascochyta rabiei]UPX10709.1 hypothetical protein EKO05_0001351 [Ascochyta rabiei]